jgi:hypothetical protein
VNVPPEAVKNAEVHKALIECIWNFKPGKVFVPTIPVVFKSADVTKACSSINGQAATLALLQKMCNRILETHHMPLEDTLPGASVSLTYWSQYFMILTRMLIDAAFELDKQAAIKAPGAEQDDLKTWSQRAKQSLLEMTNMANIMFRLQGTEAPPVEIQRALAQTLDLLAAKTAAALVKKEVVWPSFDFDPESPNFVSVHLKELIRQYGSKPNGWVNTTRTATGKSAPSTAKRLAPSSDADDSDDESVQSNNNKSDAKRHKAFLGREFGGRFARRNPKTDSQKDSFKWLLDYNKTASKPLSIKVCNSVLKHDGTCREPNGKADNCFDYHGCHKCAEEGRSLADCLVPFKKCQHHGKKSD